jgi:hypothetical protein
MNSDAAMEQLRAERDEADRRAGAAERRLASLEDAAAKREQWLREAKEAAGFSPYVSFDVVWGQALEALRKDRQGGQALSCVREVILHETGPMEINDILAIIDQYSTG